MTKEPLTPYLMRAALLILSGCFCLILVQESGAFYQQIKAGQAGFPLWGGFAVAGLLELGAISVAVWCPIEWYSQFFRWGLLGLIFILTVGGATLYNVEPIREKATQLSESEKRKLNAMSQTKAAAEQLRKDKSDLSASLKSDMKSRKSELKSEKAKLSETILDQSKKIEIAALKIAEEKQFKFEFSMLNFQFFVQVFLRIIFQILAWFLASLALIKNTDNAQTMHRQKKPEIVNKLSEDNEQTMKDNGIKSVSYKDADNSLTMSDNLQTMPPEHKTILDYIYIRSEVKWTRIIADKNLRFLGSAKIEKAINELEKKGFVQWEKPDTKKGTWEVVYSGGERTDVED